MVRHLSDCPNLTYEPCDLLVLHLPLSMAHMLLVPVPDWFHRKRVVSVRAALGRGMDILVHLQRKKWKHETWTEIKYTNTYTLMCIYTRCSCQKSRRCCEVNVVQNRAQADTQCAAETRSDPGWWRTLNWHWQKQNIQHSFHTLHICGVTAVQKHNVFLSAHLHLCLGSTNTPVGRLVGATAQVDGELSNMCLCAREHREKLHEVHGPHVTVGPSMWPLLQAKLGDGRL